jgi:hypothetical protein
VFELARPLTVPLQLKTPDLASLAEALAARYGATPGLFEHEPLCGTSACCARRPSCPISPRLARWPAGFNPMAAAAAA